MIRFSIIFILIIAFNFAEGQTFTRYSLNSASLNNSAVSFSVGELASQTLSSTAGSLTQGFQQPFVFIYNKDEKNNLPENLNINFFPNPFDKFARIMICSKTPITNIQLKISDLKGRCVFEKKYFYDNQVHNATLPLNFMSFEKGLYLLQITINQTILSNYKILKQ